MSFSFKGILVVTGVFALAALAAMFGVSSGSKADAPAYWITIDSAELAVVRNNAKADGFAAKLAEFESRDGLSIVRLDELDSQALSSHMHDEFHKCAGFMRHTTLDEARKSIQQSLNASSDQVFVDYTINNASTVTPMINEAVEPSIRQMIIDLSAIHTRRHDQQGGLDGANLILSRWQTLAAGRSDITVEHFMHRNINNPGTFLTPQPTVIMTITGTTLPNEIVVIGGHQDSIVGGSTTGRSPGADDDASGIATMTEVIRVMMDSNYRPERTIQFMAYAAEEIGLVGSNNIAGIYRSLNRNVVGVLQLDMTNYAGTWADIVLMTDFTNAAQNEFLHDLGDFYFPEYEIKNDTCGYGCSDHYSWHLNSYPASIPFEAKHSTSGVGRQSNTQIHTVNDTISRSNNNADHALKFARLAIAYAGELAKGSLQPTAPARTKFDFDGDGKADVGVFRPSDGLWHLNNSTGGYAAFPFGLAGDKIIPGDYDGDGKTDVAVFRTGIWHLLRSSEGYTSFMWGVDGDIPQPNDFDGDGIDDVAVFRPSDGMWYIRFSNDGSTTAFPFGSNGDRPVSGDFDGDGKADPAVYRAGTWHILGSVSGYGAFNFGIATDDVLVSDFDGDGKVDPTVYRDGIWYTNKSTGGVSIINWGLASDIPAAADFDGDGKADLSVYRNGVWYINRSSDSGFRIELFGIVNDVPASSAFVSVN